MSNEVNTRILEEGAELAEIWTGTTLGNMLDMAVKHKDLDRIQELTTLIANELEEN